MTGESSIASVVLVCPICGETYDSPGSVRELFRNSGYCVNITCLTDLSRLPLPEGLVLERGDRRTRSH